MRLTVFATLILTLIVGLTLVQMDANTNTAFQPLSDAEMFATQGAGRSVSPCTQMQIGSHLADRPECGDKPCFREWTGKGWLSYIQEGHEFAICLGGSSSTDCITTDEYTQICALKYEYHSGWCWKRTRRIYEVEVDAVYTVPTAHLCTSS